MSKGEKSKFMFNDQKQYLRLVQITSDLICLAIFYFLFIPLFLSISNDSFPSSLFSKSMMGESFYTTFLYIKLSPAFIFIPLIFMLVFRTYNKIDVKNIKIACYQSALLCILSAGILFIILLFFNLTVKENTSISVISGLLLLPIFALNRFHISWQLSKSNSNNNLIKHILLVGTGFHAQSISNYIETHPECGLRVAGFLTNKDHEIGKTVSNKKVLGNVKDLIKIIGEHFTDCVLYAGNNGYHKYHDSLLRDCFIMGLDFATTEFENIGYLPEHKVVFPEFIGNIELKIIKFVYIFPLSVFLKRLFDFTASSLLILLLLPIWIVLPILIKSTSPGPVFFRQERIGKYGKKFILYKFRSMVANAEIMQEKLIHLNEMDGPAFKIKNDPRMTSTGNFLRKYSLDELPQLFNVFKGDISLVGPRPAIGKEVLQYHPIDRKRLSITQGITCIWQISGRNDIKFDEWMKLDLMYIDNWSSAQDFRILFKTIPAVFLKKGAY